MHIVLISAKQGGGKSTLQGHLAKEVSRFGHIDIQTYKFADPLYAMHDAVLEKMEQFTGIGRVKKDGVLLQLLGTEWGRKVYGDNVWVEILRRKLDMYKDIRNYMAIIDDCRFENEFDAFPDALRIRLECPEEERKVRTDAWRDNTSHPSEIGLDRYALEGKFDLYFDTSSQGHTSEHIATLIIAQLQKNSWREKRR